MVNRLVFGALQVSLLLGGSACSRSPGKPTLQQMQQPVGDYLLGYKKTSCDGEVRLQSVEVKRIGEFDKNLGGFPVFADFAVTCDARPSGIMTVSSTFEANDGATTTAAVCYARPAGGAHSCFMPEIVRRAEQQMKRQMDEAMGKLVK